MTRIGHIVIQSCPAGLVIRDDAEDQEVVVPPEHLPKVIAALDHFSPESVADILLDALAAQASFGRSLRAVVALCDEADKDGHPLTVAQVRDAMGGG